MRPAWAVALALAPGPLVAGSLQAGPLGFGIAVEDGQDLPLGAAQILTANIAAGRHLPFAIRYEEEVLSTRGARATSHSRHLLS